MQDNLIVLNDEDGNGFQFELLDMISYGYEDYIVLLPVDDEEDQVVILLIDEDEYGNESYLSVEDSSILEAVFDIFKERHESEFNFID